jgi:hypothetical protein
MAGESMREVFRKSDGGSLWEDEEPPPTAP